MRSWVRCVIFDLDGVLVDTKQLHFDAFKQAVQEYAGFIVDEAWYFRYDGVTSKQKLELLASEGSVPEETHDAIMDRKRTLTLDLIDQHIRPDADKTLLFESLRQYHDVKVCVASNSRCEFVKRILRCLGIGKYVDVIIGNELVSSPKPAPNMFMECMLHVDVTPSQTLVFEDTVVGHKAALDAGANLVKVKSVSDITLPYVLNAIHDLELCRRDSTYETFFVHGLDSINIVVPMAGHGSRFSKAGYSRPKPFIDVRGKLMVQVTIDSIGIPGRYVFCAQKEHVDRFPDQMARLQNPRDQVIEVNTVTQGAACTVLLAEEHIDNDNPLFIINSDQYIEWDWSRFMIETLAQNADGGIVVFEADGPKWSYAKTAPGTNRVIEVAEKRPISTHATAGIYYWRRGRDFVRFARQMIAKDVRVNNEFYVAPVYNEAIEAGLNIVTFPCERMLGMGTPEDLQENLPKL